MTERTTHTTVTFVRPFSLADLEDVQPAGTYRIETTDALLDGLTFLAYRRVSTTIELPAIGGAGLRRQVITIDPAELKLALEADALPGISPPLSGLGLPGCDRVSRIRWCRSALVAASLRPTIQPTCSKAAPMTIERARAFSTMDAAATCNWPTHSLVATAASGRAFAAYGAFTSLPRWRGYGLQKVYGPCWDIVGAIGCIAGAAIIFLGPRPLSKAAT